MKILILGGTGYVGSSIATKLYNDGHKVTILSRHRLNPENPQIQKSINCDYIYGNYNNEDELKSALTSIDIVIHSISTTTPGSSNLNPIYDIESNLIPFVKLLQIVCQSQAKKMIFISSGGTIYGDNNLAITSEEAQKFPISSYGIVKLTMENYMTMILNESNVAPIIFRLSNPYGGNQSALKGQGIVAIFADKLSKNQDIEIWGDGENVRDFIFIDDVTNAIAKAINSDQLNGAYNLGSGTGKSVNQILCEIQKTISSKSKINYFDKRGIDVKRIVLDINKLSCALDWQPQISIETGIKLAVEKYITTK